MIVAYGGGGLMPTKVYKGTIKIKKKCAKAILPCEVVHRTKSGLQAPSYTNENPSSTTDIQPEIKILQWEIEKHVFFAGLCCVRRIKPEIRKFQLTFPELELDEKDTIQAND